MLCVLCAERVASCLVIWPGNAVDIMRALQSQRVSLNLSDGYLRSCDSCALHMRALFNTHGRSMRTVPLQLVDATKEFWAELARVCRQVGTLWESLDNLCRLSDGRICTGCYTLHEQCRPLWAHQRKCCPDCTHSAC